MGSKLDLRSYLAFLAENRPREFRTVTSEISPRWGVAAAVAKLEGALRNPVLKFSNVTGCNWPIVTNVCASIPRIARSVGLSTQELETNLEEMYERPVEPVIVDSAESPVREVICTGDSVDLSILPETRHTEVETASYITAAALVAWDPDCANLNVSYHRLMVVDKNSVAVYMVPGAHLDRIVQSNASRKENTPVAAFVGSHPIWSLGLLAGGSREVSELSMIGALLGEALEVVPGLLNDRILVPARAELCLEGVIDPFSLVEEGPYGEFAGYAMPSDKRPRLEVHAMSHRVDPLYQEIVAGHLEHLTMTGATMLADLKRKLADEFRGILELHMPAAMTLYVRIDTKVMGETEVERFLRHVLEGETYVKQVVCFDGDVDLKKLQSTQWAIATRTQANRDYVILPGLPGTGMDPSEIDGKTAKVGINATAKPSLDEFPARNRIPSDALDSIDIRKLFD